MAHFPARVLPLLVFLLAGAAAAQDALDGLSFSGMTGEKGKGDHHADTITFRDGIFRSLDCENWGFGPAPYEMERVSNGYRFTAILKSPDRGELAWTGTIVDNTARATFRWTHKRWYWTIERDYWFEGTRDTKRPSASSPAVRTR